MADKTKILALYRTLLKESKQVPTYNFREFFIRRIRETFKDNKTLTDSKAIQKQVDSAMENLSVIRRQAVIGNMYKTDKLVIEK